MIFRRTVSISHGIVDKVQPWATPTLTAIFLLLLFTCGERGWDKKETDDGTPLRGGTLILSLQESVTLDPHLVQDVYSALVTNQIFEGLIEFDNNAGPAPALAETWVISDDRLNYTFRLRPGVKFHDGQQLTTEDVIYSFHRLFSPGSERGSIAFDLLGKIRGVPEYREGKADKIIGIIALDDSTLTIGLSEPYFVFLSALATDQVKIVHGKSVKERGEDQLVQDAVGTGAFIFDGYDEKNALILKANPEYYRGRPLLDGIEFRAAYLPDAVDPFDAFLAGELHQIELPSDSSYYKRLDRMHRILIRPELSLEYIGINISIPPLNYREVRRALLSRMTEGNVGMAWEGTDIAAEGVLPPNMPGYIPRTRQKPTRTPEDLAAAFRKEVGDQRWRVGYWTTDSTDASILHNTLKEFNTDLDIHVVDWEEMNEKLMNGEAAFWSMAWVADLPEPTGFLRSLFHTDGSNNYFNYSNREVNDLIEEAESTEDMKLRAELFRRIENIILFDVPAIPIAHYVNAYALQPEVKDFDFSQLGLSTVKLRNVWLAK